MNPRRKRMVWIGPIALLCVILAPLPVRPADTPGGDLPEWFSAPIERDRHTTLLARFDGRSDADYERDGRGVAGRGYDTTVAGKHGGGIEIDIPGAQINFVARGNMRAARGTVQFWLKSKPGRNIWSDGKEHWLFSAVALKRNLELWKDSQNRLRLSWGGRPWDGDDEVMGELSAPVEGLRANEWHHLAFSWDSEAGQLWLAVNRKYQSRSLGRPMGIDRFHMFFVGASHYGGVGPNGLDSEVMLKTAGAIFDELKIADLARSRDHTAA